MPEITLATTVVQSPNLVATQLGQEIVILGLDSELYYSLSEVGAQIWKLIESPMSVQSVLDALLKQYAVDPALCQADLLAILQDLTAEGLIEVQ
jgi:hypothetical protein